MSNKQSVQAGHHVLADRKDDLYETPPEATRALLQVETFPLNIWEPACGRGAISYVLRQAGFGVWSTDLVTYGGFTPDEGGVDFLMETRAPPHCSAIITNPPFKLANEFVRHALTLCPKVVMLLRLAFLEATGRSDILEGALSRVHVFRNRLPMMHRDGWTGPRAPSSTAYAWFVWDAEHEGSTIINRISWE